MPDYLLTNFPILPKSWWLYEYLLDLTHSRLPKRVTDDVPEGLGRRAEPLSQYLRQGTLGGRPLSSSQWGHWGTALLRTPWPDTWTRPWQWWRLENLMQRILIDRNVLFNFTSNDMDTLYGIMWCCARGRLPHRRCSGGRFPSGASPPRWGASGKRFSVCSHICCWSSL